MIVAITKSVQAGSLGLVSVINSRIGILPTGIQLQL